MKPARRSGARTEGCCSAAQQACLGGGEHLRRSSGGKEPCGAAWLPCHPPIRRFQRGFVDPQLNHASPDPGYVWDYGWYQGPGHRELVQMVRLRLQVVERREEWCPGAGEVEKTGGVAAGCASTACADTVIEPRASPSCVVGATPQRQLHPPQRHPQLQRRLPQVEHHSLRTQHCECRGGTFGQVCRLFRERAGCSLGK